MVALLQRLGILPTEAAPKSDGKAVPEHGYEGDLTRDQIAYLHELADERRRAWVEAKRVS